MRDLPHAETRAEFARRLDVARPQMTKLAKRGLPLDEAGRVMVREALGWIVGTLDPRRSKAAISAKRILEEAAPPVEAAPSPVPRAEVPAGAVSIVRSLLAEAGIEDRGAIELNDARTAGELVKAATSELKRRQVEGELIDVRTAERRVGALAKGVRDSWVMWPSRVAAVIAADLGVEAVDVQRALDRHVRAHLEELADDDIRLG